MASNTITWLSAPNVRHPRLPERGELVRLASALAMERNEKWLAKRYVAALDNILTPTTLNAAA